MPEINAVYEEYSYTGLNYSERYGDFDPKAKIQEISPHLYNFMNTLANETYYDYKAQKEKNRSAFSCAEAEALAGILEKIKKEVANPDYTKIRFSRPTSGYGYQLWEPCRNCSVWLESAEGWGSEKKYKLSATALQKLLQK